MTSSKGRVGSEPRTLAGRALHKAEMFDLTIAEDRRRLAIAIEQEAAALLPEPTLDVERLRRAIEATRDRNTSLDPYEIAAEYARLSSESSPAEEGVE